MEKRGGSLPTQGSQEPNLGGAVSGFGDFKQKNTLKLLKKVCKKLYRGLGFFCSQSFSPTLS
jgi:hypothetical protein